MGTKQYYDRKNAKLCVGCGETEPHFLTIDHIHGGGSKHCKEIGSQTYRWIVANNFPDGFQVLCMNCNWGRRFCNGVCPHKVNYE